MYVPNASIQGPSSFFMNLVTTVHAFIFLTRSMGSGESSPSMIPCEHAIVLVYVSPITNDFSSIQYPYVQLLECVPWVLIPFLKLCSHRMCAGKPHITHLYYLST